MGSRCSMQLDKEYVNPKFNQTYRHPTKPKIKIKKSSKNMFNLYDEANFQKFSKEHLFKNNVREKLNKENIFQKGSNMKLIIESKEVDKNELIKILNDKNNRREIITNFDSTIIHMNEETNKDEKFMICTYLEPQIFFEKIPQFVVKRKFNYSTNSKKLSNILFQNEEIKSNTNANAQIDTNFHNTEAEVKTFKEKIDYNFESNNCTKFKENENLKEKVNYKSINEIQRTNIPLLLKNLKRKINERKF